MQNKNPQLTIYYSTQKQRELAILVPTIGIAYLLIFFTIKNIVGNSYLEIAIKTGLGIIVALFFVGCIVNFIQLGSKKPLAIINSDGFWVSHFGLIPWDNIHNILPLDFHQHTSELICIQVINLKLLSKNADLQGKLAIFWAQISGHQPVILGNIDLPTETVIDFAKEFLNK